MKERRGNVYVWGVRGEDSEGVRRRGQEGVRRRGQ